MSKIAITGGIGSGKSYVCRLLRDRGIDVYDCDAAAKRLMRGSLTLQERLNDLVGGGLFDEGVFDKARLARYMLQSEEHTSQVNAIVHPAVGRDFILSGKDWMECAILFESGFERYVDYVVCVAAPLEVRISRVMERDGISREKVLEWMGRQWPQEKVLLHSDYVIHNDGLQDLEPQISSLLKGLERELKGS